jgi:hypothetical protein
VLFCASKSITSNPTEHPERLYDNVYEKPSVSVLRVEVLMTVKMSIMVFWVMTPCGLVGVYHCSSETVETTHKTT